MPGPSSPPATGRPARALSPSPPGAADQRPAQLWAPTPPLKPNANPSGQPRSQSRRGSGPLQERIQAAKTPAWQYGVCASGQSTTEEDPAAEPKGQRTTAPWRCARVAAWKDGTSGSASAGRPVAGGELGPDTGRSGLGAPSGGAGGSQAGVTARVCGSWGLPTCPDIGLPCARDVHQEPSPVREPLEPVLHARQCRHVGWLPVFSFKYLAARKK